MDVTEKKAVDWIIAQTTGKYINYFFICDRYMINNTFQEYYVVLYMTW